MHRSIFLMLALAFGLTACDQKSTTENAKDRARIEEEANTEVQRRTLTEKVQKMETDLATRHYFYGAVEGKYEGDLKTDFAELKIRLTLVRSIPAYEGSRTRELSEVEADLNNLYFHAQVIQWDPKSPASAVGCRITNLRPNLETGVMTIASADCPNLYTIYLSNESKLSTSTNNDVVTPQSQDIAQKVRSKQIASVPALQGFIQPSSNSSVYQFKVTRVKNEVKP